MRFFMAGIAACALAASGALAQPGNGNGNGNGKGGSPSAKAQGGPKADRGGGPSAKAQGGPKAERGGGPAVRNANAQRERGPAFKADRGNGGNGNSQGRRSFENAQGEQFREVRGNGRVRAQGPDRGPYDDRRYADTGRDFGLFRDYDRQQGAFEGCPPGLAKKYNGCTPPGLARKRETYDPSFFGFSGLTNSRFYYDDGYLLRLGDGGRIASTIPLLGGALAIGNDWPSFYQPFEVRPYYRDYFGLEPNGYRYANNTIFRVDPQTAAIQSIAALLTGDEFTVGQPVPSGYDVYNVPYRYRDQYVDGPQGYYRYSDGYVYQVDPETRLVAAAIELALN